MEINELITRINFLYHKRQTEGLTETEQTEQSELRRQYIDIIKGKGIFFIAALLRYVILK
jgi:uncharacterized protein YnzC (UPF0291/DUF896 family)